jgi:hypothetical protein
MTKRKAARGSASATRPKRLRKRLRKAEAKRAKAEAKRARAQARVEALTIIADEIRAQLAESETAAADAEADAGKLTDTSHATASTPKRTTGKSPTPSKASTSVTAT